MKTAILTEALLPASIAVIMCSLGMRLSGADFRRVLSSPRAALIGIASVALISPLLALASASVFGLSPKLAVGLVLLGAAPGGMMANMLTHLSRGDTALSITMTVIGNIAAVLTLPLFIGLSAAHFGAAGLGRASTLAVLARVFALTIVPVGIGMALRQHRPQRVEAAYPRLRDLSLALFALVVGAAIAAEYGSVAANLSEVGAAALTLNLAAMSVSFAASKLARLDDRQATAISLGAGIHNAVLAIAVAAPLAAAATIPAAVYASFMLLTCGAFAWAMSARNAALLARATTEESRLDLV